MRCHYNAVNFFRNHHNRYLRALPWVRNIGCLLCGQALVYILPWSLQCCMHYRVILDSVIMALRCTLHSANMKAMGGDGWVYHTSFGKLWPLDIVIYVLEKHNGHNCRKDSCGISFDGKVQKSELSIHVTTWTSHRKLKSCMHQKFHIRLLFFENIFFCNDLLIINKRSND